MQGQVQTELTVVTHHAGTVIHGSICVVVDGSGERAAAEAGAGGCTETDVVHTETTCVELVSTEVEDGPQRQTARGTTTTGEHEACIIRDAELVVTVDRSGLVVGGVKAIEVTSTKDGVTGSSVVDDGCVVAPVQEDVVGQVQDVARAVRVSEAARQEARTVVGRSVSAVVEGVAVRATTDHARTGHTKRTEAVVVGLAVENLTGVVLDDLPLLLTREGTTRDVEDVALRVGQAEDVVTLLAIDEGELSVVEATLVDHFTAAVEQGVGRSVPAVTEGVEHHELNEGLSVLTAREYTASVVHGGITAVVEGRVVGTTAHLCRGAEVELGRSTTLAEDDGLAGVHVDEGEADLTQEGTATGVQGVATRGQADGVLTFGAGNRLRSVEATAGNQVAVVVELVGVAVPAVTKGVEHAHEDHGLAAVRASVEEAGAVVEGRRLVVVEGRRIRATRDVRRQGEGPRLEAVVAETTAVGHGSGTGACTVEGPSVHGETGTSITVVVAHGHGVVTGTERRHTEVGRGVRTTRPKHGVVGYVEDRVPIKGHDAHIKFARIAVRIERNRLCLHRRKKGQSEDAKDTSENGSSQVHD